MSRSTAVVNASPAPSLSSIRPIRLCTSPSWFGSSLEQGGVLGHRFFVLLGATVEFGEFGTEEGRLTEALAALPEHVDGLLEEPGFDLGGVDEPVRRGIVGRGVECGLPRLLGRFEVAVEDVEPAGLGQQVRRRGRLLDARVDEGERVVVALDGDVGLLQLVVDGERAGVGGVEVFEERERAIGLARAEVGVGEAKLGRRRVGVLLNRRARGAAPTRDRPRRQRARGRRGGDDGAGIGGRASSGVVVWKLNA